MKVREDMLKSTFLNEEDRKMIMKSGFGQRRGFGNKPLLLLIDCQRAALDEKSPLSVGNHGWDIIKNIKTLINIFRGKGLPLIYIIVTKRKNEAVFDSFSYKKTAKAKTALLKDGAEGIKIPKEIEPLPNEVVLSKKYPSAFFGTPLMSFLNTLKVDTLIVVGFTTSGCVRASVIDAFSYNFNVVIVEECVGDRIDASHRMSLFDMHLKYADVTSMDDVKNYLESFTDKNPTP